nr:hypothetical protein [Acetobacter malorum]
MPAVEWLPLGSRLTLLAQDRRTPENRIAIQKSDFRKQQKKNENTSEMEWIYFEKFRIFKK